MGDLNGQAQMTGICNLLQETASYHANELGIGVDMMREMGMFWALYRFSVRLEKYPKIGEQIKIDTWVSSVKGPFSEREYHIFLKDGSHIGGASSLWFAVNEQSRKPQSVEHMRKDTPIYKGRKGLENKPIKIPENSGAELDNQVNLGYGDFDHNRHVNNVRYIQWLIDSFPISKFHSHEIEGIDVNFLGEARENEMELKCFHTTLSNISDYHCLKNSEDVDLCRMITTWRKLDHS